MTFPKQFTIPASLIILSKLPSTHALECVVDQSSGQQFCNGLSVAARIGIAVGAFALAMVILIILGLTRRRRIQRRQQVYAPNSKSDPRPYYPPQDRDEIYVSYPQAAYSPPQTYIYYSPSGQQPPLYPVDPRLSLPPGDYDTNMTPVYPAYYTPLPAPHIESEAYNQHR
ncbi:hypothetical protein BU17DRAFT_83224 [Hysterangium stoloniferum]|nr:hypothetical protein BU17DRAFT_83224 [Hysterangium stoloniferum]